MTDLRDADDAAQPIFLGLVSSDARRSEGARHRGEPRRRSLGDGFRKTLPFVVASAMTVGLNLTGPVEPVAAAPKKPAKPKSDLTTSMRNLLGSARVGHGGGNAAAVTSYTVKAGDTVASIAGRHGVSTASVLALNGLGWKSLIFPGQVLKLAPGANPLPTAKQEGGRYTIVRGDTISRIAARFGVSVESVLRANGLGWSSIIYPGQTIAIPAAPAPPAPATPAPSVELVSSVTPTTSETPSTSSYTIASGDTVSGIAARFGVTTASILSANGLTASSIIYPGQKLVIPAAGGGSSSGSSSASPAGSVTTLTAEQTANARIIIQVGRQQGVPDYGIIIALATAMQESSLRNIAYGDRDSVGLFQQRPSTGWGTVDEIMNPHHAAFLFYQGRSGYTRGLLDISGWQSMALTVAAQKVQISAYPDHYAKWETSARAWFAALA